MDDIHFQYGDHLITIVQLQQLWMSNPDLILVVKEKVLGRPEDVANYIENDSILIDGYTYTTTMNNVYVEELTKYKEWLHETMSLQAAENGNTFDTLLHVPRTNSLNTIGSKLSTLPYGKYLDVSDLNNLKVLGPNKNKFVGTKSRLMSTNYDSFFTALCSIESAASRYADDIRAAKKYFHITSSTLKEVCTVSSAKDTTVPEKVTRTYTRKVRPKTLMQLLNSLKDNKVIDVSTIDDKGFDAVIISKNDIKEDQFTAEKVPLVSDNLERFERAIFLLRGEERFKSDLIKARLYFNQEDATFLDILGTLEENEVVDVSDIDEDGVGAFVIKEEDIVYGYYKGREIRITSNNYEAFERAIMLSEGGYFTYKSDLQRAKLFFDKGYLDVSKLVDAMDGIVIDEDDIGDKYVSTVSSINVVSDNLPGLMKAYTQIGLDNGEFKEEFKEDIELAREYFGYNGQLPEKYMNILTSNNRKYLDVSNIKEEDASGIVIINEKDIGDKYTAINVKIVSDNYDAFIRALMLLPSKDFFTYGDDIHFAKQYFGSSSSSLDNI